MDNGDNLDKNTNNIVTSVTIILAILTMLILFYYLRPTTDNFRTTPGIETPTLPEGQRTITTPSESNPRI